jgi:hypothetical protein
VVWPHKDAFLVVDKKTARVEPVFINDSAFAKMAAMHARNLPPGLVSVDAVATWEAQKTSVLVGKNEDGDVAITMLTPNPSKALAVLPKDATFRGLRPQSDASGQNVVGRFVVDYTLPGDPVEVERYRHVVVDLFDSLSDFLGVRP